MNDNLQTLTNLALFLYQEINRCANNPDFNNQTYTKLKEAAIKTIEVGQSIEAARAWNINNNNNKVN